MSEKRFEEDCDENICSFDYSTLDTYYEFDGERIIEWNKHSDNAQYTDSERITEILNIKQMRLESLMKHREEIDKLFDRIEEQQDTITELKKLLNELSDENRQLKEENEKLIQQKCLPCELANLQTRKIDKLKEENEQLKKDDLLFFQQVFDILMKYQHLFNREMADEVLEDLGIELAEWFE